MTEFSVRGSNVVVVGAGRSGVGAARLLAGRGARVTLTEMRSDVGEEVERLREVGVELELGGHRPETLAGADLVVLSPGVPPSLAALARARLARVPVISEIELASRWVRGRIVAVTGTKGKSTTSVLTGRVLEAAGYRVQREYYVNDSGNQIGHFHKTLLARYKQAHGGDERPI